MATIAKVELEKAFVSLQEAHKACLDQETDSKIYKLFRDAAIQRFEFCIELSWKVSMKNLGLSISSPKQAVREMLKAGLISDFEKWFDFIEARNKSSHTYDDDIAKEVFAYIEPFMTEANLLIPQL